MIEVRCPKCGKLLGYFSGAGEVQCPRCRKNALVVFDTDKGLVTVKK